MRIFIVILLIIGVCGFFYKNTYEEYREFGNSMYPVLQDGMIVKVYPHITPDIGDIVVIECTSTKCFGSEMRKKGINKVNKYLRKKDKDCIWIEGLSENSFDSGDYGWLCKGEFNLIGVIKKP